MLLLCQRKIGVALLADTSASAMEKVATIAENTEGRHSLRRYALAISQKEKQNEVFVILHHSVALALPRSRRKVVCYKI